MPSVTARLSQIFGDAFAATGVDRSYGAVVVSQRPELAQYQCNGALAAAKPAGRRPRELAAAVIEAIAPNDVIAATEIAGPGFINIDVTRSYLAGVVQAMSDGERLGVDLAESRHVVVDYGGPNVAKALHVGHLRPAIIGEAVKRILRFAGHDAIGDVHLGDWGLSMGQVIALVERRHPELPYFDPDIEGPYPTESPVSFADLDRLYPEAAALHKDDPEFAAEARRATVALQDGRPGYRALWEHFRNVSIADMKKIYGDLNVSFELWYGESSVHDRIAPMLDRLKAAGVVEESDGALIVEVARPDDTKEIPPLILVKSDGGYLYSTTDLATVEERVDDLGAEAVLYVVDARQALHFEQIFRAARLGGIAPGNVVLEHDPFGTVNGPGGKPLRTRDGDLPALRGLIDEAVERAAQRLEENDLATEYSADERARIAALVGVAALKYGDLQNHRTSDYVFDLDRFVSFDGRTGPYLLYSAVRIQSILRNAEERGVSLGPLIPPTVDAERGLMLRLVRLPDVIDRAVEFRAPNHIAEFAYDVATDFNRFYEACHILNEPDPARQSSWLALVSLTLDVLKTLLDLLAIDVPERM